MTLQLRSTLEQIKFVVRRCSGIQRIVLLAALAGAVASYSVPASAQATFTPLGQFGGIRSGASDISADGSVIVGTTIGGAGPTVSVFRVTPQGTTVRSTGLIGTEFSREPSVSADGSTVVGAFLSSRGEEAFRWVGDGPFTGLGDLPGGDFQSSAADVSADGSVVVGASRGAARSEAFRWTAGGGMAALGGEARTARAVSADGSVVVGSLWSGNDSVGSAYRWTMQTGTMELPRITRETFFVGGEATALTPDGSVIVGYNSFRVGISSTADVPLRWTQSGTTILDPTPIVFNAPSDVSGNGSVIVGSGRLPFIVPGAHFWTAETGMLGLQDVLVFGGATNLDDWTIVSAEAISANGRTVVGMARHRGDDHHEAFVATIGAIPEPSTLILAALAAAALFAVHAGIPRRAFGRHQGTVRRPCHN